MKLSLAATALSFLAPVVEGLSQTLIDQYNFRDPQTYVGNSMWLFGQDGVYVFSPDGSEQRSHLPSDLVCEDAATFTGQPWEYCRFNDMVSDGKNYVWAATSRDGSAITAFDIDTAAMVGTFKACQDAHDLEYHPLREEIWVRCHDLDTASSDPTHLDVLSATNPSGEIQTNILMGERALGEGLSSSGYSVIHPALGDVGYLTDDSNPNLFMIDLSTKAVLDTFQLSPAAHGLYEAAFSPVNKHIFVRAVMCCSCGTTGADLESCGRSDGYGVNPTTGNSAGMMNVTGVCGRSCSGVAGVDTVGAYEFDTANKTVVATHELAEGIGGDPYPSPDGRHIILMGRNGGKTVRVLKAGAPGSPSTVLVDLALEFDRQGYENLPVAKDFAFVQNDGKTILVIPSGTSHKVAIVDFDNNYSTKYVTFSDAEFVNTAPHGRYRSVEWAVGTDYVWTNDSTEDEHYVIDVKKAELVKTITGIDRSSMLSVQNWQRVHSAQQQEQLLMSMDDVDDNEFPWLNIAAIGVGLLALIVGVLNISYLNSTKNGIHTQFNARMDNMEENMRPLRVAPKKKLPIDHIRDPRDDPLGVSA